MKTILEQFVLGAQYEDWQCVCPNCRRRIESYYEVASKMIENGLCPFCDCEEFEEDGEPTFLKRHRENEWMTKYKPRELTRQRCLGY